VKKSRKQKKEYSRQEPNVLAGSASGFTQGRSLSPLKKWGFRVLSLLLPLVLILIFECFLRLTSAGISPNFFLKEQTEKWGPVWVENNLYTSLFFPKGLERGVHGFSFPVQKSPDTLRIFVLGESAALGDPEPSFGFSRILQVMLEKRFPERKIEVVNLSITAINSHVIREIARCAAGAKADYWILYMGNNEVVGPYGASTIFSSQTPPLWMVRTTILLKRTFTGQLLFRIWGRFSSAEMPRRWEGMQMFLEKQVPWNDRQLKQVHKNFQANLNAILKEGNRCGAQMLLCTVAVNEHDFPPFGSLNNPALSPEEFAQWRKEFDAGIACEERADFATAATHYAKALQIDNSYAEIHFRLARVLEAAGNLPESKSHYLKARDLDTVRFRTDSVLNSIIRGSAEKRDVKLLDLAQILAADSHMGLIGEKTLLEHVHFTWNGNYQVASNLYTALEGLVDTKDAQQPIDSKEASFLLGHNPHSEYLLWEEMKRRFREEPFRSQAYQEARSLQLEKRLNSLRANAKSGAIHSALQETKRALLQRPEDFELRVYLAQLSDSVGDFDGAIEQITQVRMFHPRHTQAEMVLGSVLEKKGDFENALRQYEYVLSFNPLLSEALFKAARLKLIFGNDPKGAWLHIKRAFNSLYDSPAALTLAGDISQQLNKVHSAESFYRQALELEPSFGEAAVKLAGLYRKQKRDESAIEVLTACIEKSSSLLEIRLELADIYLSRRETHNALNQIEAALRLSPNNPRALELQSRVLSTNRN